MDKTQKKFDLVSEIQGMTHWIWQNGRFKKDNSCKRVIEMETKVVTEYFFGQHWLSGPATEITSDTSLPWDNSDCYKHKNER